MLRLRDSLLLTLVGAACWAMVTSSGQGCNDSFALGGGGSTSGGGFGGTTEGLGGINYATCGACLDPTSGAPVHQCVDEVAACEADAACRALLACTEGGTDVTSGGAGGTTSSSGVGGAGGTTSVGAGGTVASGGGGATAAGGGATTTTSAGTGGATGGSSHARCDTSVFGACCMLDCAAALGTPTDSTERFFQRTRCLDCANCKTQCMISDAFCSAIQEGAEDNCGG